MTDPVYSYTDAIRESVWVKAPDGDGDHQMDLVTADIIRPRELDGVTTVPVIIDPSPYYLCCGRGNEGERKSYDADGNPLKFPLFYDNYFEPRGYAIVHVDMAGTARSSGCSDEGSASDIRSVRAVVDWLNHRATAVDIDGNPATAYWANGTVGMIGKSYDGTLANGVAGTGVEGLKTVVPISAISSWYDYDRSQGLPFSYNYPGRAVPARGAAAYSKRELLRDQRPDEQERRRRDRVPTPRSGRGGTTAPRRCRRPRG